MVNWTISIPETPSPNYVIVKNISPQSSEKTVKEFFLFCGKIKEFELVKEDEHQTALINFERESAAKTAALLSNALIDDSHILAAPYFESTVSGNDEPETQPENAQETKPKSRIAAEILANGYLLQDHIVAKGLEYDTKYNLSSRLTGYLQTLQSNVKTFDEKYRIWDKAMEYNEKFKIQEKVNNVATTAQSRAVNALQTPTGQKVHDFAQQTLAQIAAVHYEAKKIQGDKLIHQTTANTNTAAPAEPAKATAA
ncbi:hypothetical protein BDA99DRAFT_512905 [Phascolomyces articulosus]|uniref:RRM domain-containing protein n=1 Tax=Phascolomyces articulosus TaxID=60185 RepID=A0AAD5JYJ4_9FUNG|nr:hypothetical protein BDA99DRAFT_512905 [Phascolomyces articulosus]